MQVSATLIAAQQAAREARARLAIAQVPKASAAAATQNANGTSSLSKESGTGVLAAQTAQPTTAASPLGRHLDIKV